MKKIFLVLFIVLGLNMQADAVDVKLDSAVVYLTSPEFSLPVRVTPVNNLYGAAFDLLYDTNLLEICGVAEGNIFDRNGVDSTFLRSALEDGSAGRLVLGIVRGDTAGINVTQEGVFLNIGFRAKNVGITEVNFDKSELKNSYNSTISAAWTKGKVTVFASPADIEVSPSNFNLTINQGNNATQALIIKNNGGEPLAFNISDNVDWLAEDKTSGIVSIGDSTLIALNLASSSLILGNYNTNIEIISNDPNKTLISIPLNLLIYNQPPTVTLNANPNSGFEPLQVNFTAYAADLDGGIVNYEWDFNGDGIYDTSTAFNTAAYIYNIPGIYNAAVRVTDNDSASAEAGIVIAVTIDPAHVISLTGISPNNGRGDTTTTVTINGENFDSTCRVYIESGRPYILSSTNLCPSDTGAVINALAVQVKDNYAFIAGEGFGLKTFDITNPVNPLIKGDIGNIFSGRDIAVSNGYAFISSDNTIEVIDVSHPDNPVIITSIPQGGIPLEGIFVAGGFLYAARGTMGLDIINISNPSVPVTVSNLPGNYKDMYVSGIYAYAVGSDGLDIINIAAPANPFKVNGIDPGDNFLSIAVSGNYAYVAGDSGIKIINMNNSYDLKISSAIDTSGKSVNDIKISGNYAFGKANGNLLVIDISNPASPEIISIVNGISGTGSETGIYVPGSYVYCAADLTLKIIDARIMEPFDTFTACGPINFINKNIITAVVPSGLSAGKYSIKVENSYTEGVTLHNCYTVLGNGLNTRLLYALDPAGSPQNLLGIDPADGFVKFTLPLTNTPLNFRCNTLAFNRNDELYGMDNTNCKLVKINTITGAVSVVGSLSTAYTAMGGISFDSSGNLYGIHSGTDEFYSLSTVPDAAGNIVVTTIGSLGIDVQNHGMAVKFNEDKFYGLTANLNIYDSVFTIDTTLTTTYADNFQTNTYNDYTWVQNADPSYRSGTYASYVASTQTIPGYMWMDGIYNGGLCCWIPANIDAEKTMNIPKSGQAVIYFDIAADGEGQSRIYLRLVQDNNNLYSFIVSDVTYGSSGYTQGVRKTVNGTVYSIIAPGTVYIPGPYKMTAYWSPENVRLRITNLSTGITTEHNYYPSNKTVLNPTKLVFGAYRFEAKWKSIQVSPGLATVVGSLGAQTAGVGVEFNPDPASPDELCAIRNNNQLYKYDVITKLVIGPVTILNGSNSINTVNLAAPWPK